MHISVMDKLPSSHSRGNIFLSRMFPRQHIDSIGGKMLLSVLILVIGGGMK